MYSRVVNRFKFSRKLQIVTFYMHTMIPTWWYCESLSEPIRDRYHIGSFETFFSKKNPEKVSNERKHNIKIVPSTTCTTIRDRLECIFCALIVHPRAFLCKTYIDKLHNILLVIQRYVTIRTNRYVIFSYLKWRSLNSKCVSTIPVVFTRDRRTSCSEGI